MDRRSFLAGILAVAATPALPKTLPHGFVLEGDTIYLRDVSLILDKPIKVPNLYRHVVIERCRVTVPAGVPAFDLSDTGRVASVTINGCHLISRADWPLDIGTTYRKNISFSGGYENEGPIIRSDKYEPDTLQCFAEADGSFSIEQKADTAISSFLEKVTTHG